MAAVVSASSPRFAAARTAPSNVPVVATAARSGKGLAELRHQAAEVCRREPWEDGWKLTYVPPVEAALGLLETGMSRRRAVALLWGSPPTEEEQSLWQRAQQRLGALSGQALRDSLTASVVALAEEIGRQCVRCAGPAPFPAGKSRAGAIRQARVRAVRRAGSA